MIVVECYRLIGMDGGTVERDFMWQETLYRAGNTQPVPPDDGEYELQVETYGDVYLAVGKSPDASTEPRELIVSRDTALLPADAGDRLAWRKA
ncbi:hypothetical protein [Devosia salina]|uniref:Uncharacterized protein n=1 Tax=Devosia salina TaxID=2860336 RepID=A0ABX8WB26_9HYPH|nr:hypothetical protein [Devosia salina]QYO75330.1 hypothetical protein K1X15_11785 [Devosia salina]